jgi:hypothetical protein
MRPATAALLENSYDKQDYFAPSFSLSESDKVYSMSCNTLICSFLSLTILPHASCLHMGAKKSGVTFALESRHNSINASFAC